MEKIKKHLQQHFKDNGLDVIIKCNMKVINYMDVNLISTTALTDPVKNKIT